MVQYQKPNNQRQTERHRQTNRQTETEIESLSQKSTSLTDAISASCIIHSGVRAHTLIAPVCVDAASKGVSANSRVLGTFVGVSVARDAFPGFLAEARAIDVVT